MITEFQMINKILKISEQELSNEVIVLYRKETGEFGFCVEGEYVGEEENICGKYLNGHLAST